MIHCSVLGSVEVRLHDRSVDLGSRLQVHVLALLLAARGGRVSDEHLIDCLWPDDPPAAARASLRAHVSRLRAVLDPDRAGVISRDGDGYRIPSHLVVLDATEVETLLRTAAAASSAAGRLAAAEQVTNLWRGRPYDAVPDRGTVNRDRRRLLSLHSEASRHRWSALVDLGDASVVVELATALEDDPYDEPLWRLWALALYRAGRQSDALEVLRRARTTLADGLGLEPHRDLRSLEVSILAQDPGLDLAPARTGPIQVSTSAARPVHRRRTLTTVEHPRRLAHRRPAGASWRPSWACPDAAPGVFTR